MSRAKKIILLFYFAGVILLCVWVPWETTLERKGVVIRNWYVYGPVWKPPVRDVTTPFYRTAATAQWSILGLELVGLTALCAFCLVLASSLRLPFKKELASLIVGKQFLSNSPSDTVTTPTNGKGYIHYLGEFTKIFFTFLAAVSIFGCAYSALVGKWADAIWSFAIAAVILWLLWVKKLPGA